MRRSRQAAASEAPLIEELPDLVIQLSRDGTILRHAGGRAVQGLRPAGPLDAACTGSWPAVVASLIKQLTRRAISTRETAEASFVHAERRYEVRISAQSPDRAICVIRPAAAGASPDCAADSAHALSPRLDRREFWRRFTETVSGARLSGRSIALVVIHVEGLSDILQVMDSNVCDRVIGIGLQRLSQVAGLGENQRPWYVGPLADDELALIVQGNERDTIEACAVLVCESLSCPIKLGDATFHLKAYGGAAILGQDANSQKALLENARSATTEARRSGVARISFFSDTLKLRSLTRLDMGEELRNAISNRHIRLKYRGRHDLESGQLVALVGYLQWLHPIRGEIRPAQFLGAVAATGLATGLSRALLDHLREDYLKMRPHVDPAVRISFGALRHHVLDGAFVSDIAQLLADDMIPSDRLELRISERTYVARESVEWKSFAERGVHVVVDEVGRKMSSIERLAQAPLWALQLDRACGAAVGEDATATKVCRAVVNVARALAIVPIATAVDDPTRRQHLLDMGYSQGIGDHWVSQAALDFQAALDAGN